MKVRVIFKYMEAKNLGRGRCIFQRCLNDNNNKSKGKTPIYLYHFEYFNKTHDSQVRFIHTFEDQACSHFSDIDIFLCGLFSLS